MKVRELVEQAYLEGYRLGVEQYSWWHAGVKYVGHNRPVSLTKAAETAAEIVQPHFERFLDGVQGAWQPRADPLPAAVGGASDGSL